MVTDGAKLQILDPATGEPARKTGLGTVMRSTPVYADGKVYLCTNSGIWYALKPKPDGRKYCRSCGSVRPTRTTARRSFPMAASICRRRKLCTALATRTSSRRPILCRLRQQEPPVTADEKPATLLISPYRRDPDAGRDAEVHGAALQRSWAIPANRRPDEVKFPVQGAGRDLGRRRLHRCKTRRAILARW